MSLKTQLTKNEILKNLVSEVKLLPDEYLPALLEITRALRTKIPEKKCAAIENMLYTEFKQEFEIDNFNWDDLFEDKIANSILIKEI